VGVIVTVWWTLDMLFSFFQGYNHRGVVEMRPTKTACAYLRSWFLLDFTLVALDWATLLMTALTSAFGFARSAKTLRISRIFRLIRLTRVCRLPKVLKVSNDVQHTTNSDTFQTIAKVMFWIGGILFVNHVFACSWFALGTNTRPGWVEFAKAAYLENAHKAASNSYLYATSLHWSLTQFTPASMEVVPVNTYERLFTIFTMFIALVFLSSFVSSITNEVAVFRMKKQEEKVNNATLIRFLQESHVSLDLGSRIQEVVLMQQMQQSRVHRVHEQEVLLLKNLPVSMREDLHFEVYAPRISQHPFLHGIGMMEISALNKICHTAMRQQSLLAEQDLFSYGKDGNHMYFIVAGEAVYYHGRRTAVELSKMKEARAFATATIKEGAWVCEQVLIIKWEHQGLLTARMPCEFAVVDAALFRGIVQRFPRIYSFCKRYAEAYSDRLLLTTEELTDLTLGVDDITDLVHDTTIQLPAPKRSNTDVFSKRTSSKPKK